MSEAPALHHLGAFPPNPPRLALRTDYAPPTARWRGKNLREDLRFSTGKLPYTVIIPPDPRPAHDQLQTHVESTVMTFQGHAPGSPTSRAFTGSAPPASQIVRRLSHSKGGCKESIPGSRGQHSANKRSTFRRMHRWGSGGSPLRHLFSAAMDAQLEYAAPSHLLCGMSGHGQWLTRRTG
jgi:hypothetical protein